MANRYWVGGTGTWDAVSTTNWAATSGGAGGASVPTAADNVFFDVNSNVGTGAFTVTMATTPRVCNDFTASGLDGTMTLAGTGIGLTVSGSLTFPAANFTRSYSGTTTFNATTTGKTVTTNGVAFFGPLTFDGVGGGWTLGSALNQGTSALTVTNGTFNTGGYSVTAGGIASSNSNVRTINLNASTVTLSLSSPISTTPTNLTFNAGTSTIVSTAANPSILSSLTFYNVSFTSTTAGQITISGNSVFNNLSITAPFSAGVITLFPTGDFTVNGVLSTVSTAGNRRVFFTSGSSNFQYDVTLNSAPSLTDADFRDIAIVGTASPISGTRIGNRGNCAGITFSTPKTVYWNLAGAQNWSSNGWAATSGGAVSTNNFPLPQDTAVFDNAGSVGSVQLDSAIAFISTINMSARTVAMTLGMASPTTCYGNWTNGSGTTINGSFTVTFSGGGTQTITSAGKTFTGPITVDTLGGTVQLADALSMSSPNALTVTRGTFDTTAGNYAITAAQLSSSNTNSRTIKLNASTVTLSLSSALVFTTKTNLTFNAGTSTINVASSTFNFNGNALTFYNVSFTSSALATTPSVTGANIFNNLSFASRSSASAGFGYCTFDSNQTINGTLTLNSPNIASIRGMLASDTFNTRRTLTCAAFSGGTDWDFKDIGIAGAAAPIAPTRAGDCKGNTGITFPAAKTVYYGQTGSANWGATGSGSWSATSGGALDATQFPLAQDTAIFPAATYPASGSTTTINAAYNIGTIDMSLRTTDTMTLATGTSAPSIYGNWTNGTGVSFTGTGVLTFSGRSTPQLVTGAGQTLSQPITVISTSVGGIQIQDAFRTSNVTTLTSGIIDLQSYTWTTFSFSSSNLNSRSIYFGTGNITCTGTGTVWNTSNSSFMITTGTQVVNITSVGITPITVNTGNPSQADSISYNFTGGTYALTFLQSLANTARSVDFTGFAGTLGAISSNPQLFGDLKLSTGMTLTAAASTLFFAGTSGTKKITTNGKTIDFSLNFSGVGGTFQLQDNLTIGAARSITLTNGTLDLNGVICNSGASFVTAVGTKNLTFNGGTLRCNASTTTAFNNAQPAGFTTTAGTGTGTISLAGPSNKTFVGGGSTFNCTLNQGGAGTLTITGSNTFSDITNTVQPATILFTAGTTNTFSNFSLSGTAGNLITIGSVTASSHTLSKSSGTVSCDYLSISRSTATGGAAWYAGANSTNGGNNLGWIFAAAPSASSSNFLMLLRYR